MTPYKSAAMAETLKIIEDAGKPITIAQIAVARGVVESAVRDCLRLLLEDDRMHLAMRRGNVKYFAAGSASGASMRDPIDYDDDEPCEACIAREEEIKELTIDLLQENPEWSRVRGRARAQIEYMKGRRSGQATDSV